MAKKKRKNKKLIIKTSKGVYLQGHLFGQFGNCHMATFKTNKKIKSEFICQNKTTKVSSLIVTKDAPHVFAYTTLKELEKFVRRVKRDYKSFKNRNILLNGFSRHLSPDLSFFIQVKGNRK